MFQMSEISCQEMLIKIGFKVMNIQANNDSFSTVPDGVDDAVGVEKANWYVAIVNNRSEKYLPKSCRKRGMKPMSHRKKSIDFGVTAKRRK